MSNFGRTVSRVERLLYDLRSLVTRPMAKE